MKNFTTPALAALLLATGLTIGCDQSVSDAADSAKKMAGDAVDKAKDMTGDAMGKAKDMAGDAADKAKDMTGDAVDKAKDMAGDAMDKAKDMAADGMEKVTGAEGVEGVEAGGLKDMAGDAMKGMDISSLTEGMDLSSDAASGLLDKVKDMLSSGDTQGAAGLMDKLKTVKLPEAIQPQFDALKAQLDKAMEAGNALKGLVK